jgi:uncharacterized protein
MSRPWRNCTACACARWPTPGRCSKPNAKRSAITGVREGALEVRVAAQPVDGAANDEIVAVLALALGIPRRDVHLIHGTSSRIKRIEVRGLRVEDVRMRLVVP